MAFDPRDSLELSFREQSVDSRAGTAEERGAKRFLSLYFSCANVYARAHRSGDGTSYEGRCPKCGKTIAFPIGETGTGRRMFEVRCS